MAETRADGERSCWQEGKDFMASHREMYSTKLGADVCFQLTLPDGGTEHIPAHKYVLIARSPVFETMFNERWNDATKKIVITDISPQTFHDMLR